MFRETIDEFGPFGGMHHGRSFQRNMGAFRAGRGMIEPAILHVLSEKPMHGYEIISTFEEKSHGMWRPSAGSIYPTLQLLEEKGLIVSQEIEGKKIYELTEDGRKEAGDHDAFHHQAWQGKGERLHEFHHEMGRIMMTMRTIARKGTDEQRTALGEAIQTFRKNLEAIVEEKN